MIWTWTADDKAKLISGVRIDTDMDQSKRAPNYIEPEVSETSALA